MDGAEGPPGPAGMDGAEGPPGPAGMDGADGSPEFLQNYKTLAESTFSESVMSSVPYAGGSSFFSPGAVDLVYVEKTDVSSVVKVSVKINGYLSSGISQTNSGSGSGFA
jgi:hypothetical protein